MRIVRYVDAAADAARWGIVEGEALYAASGSPFDEFGLEPAEEAGPLARARLLAPVAPSKIVCVGLNYLAHVTERDPTRVVPDEPVLFMKPPSALIGPGSAIRIANPEHRTDYEAELAMVIGRAGRNIAETDALGHVFGYTCANDVSDRTLQKKDGQWVRAKGYDTYCPVGPWIETELDIADAPVRSRLNGELRQHQTTASMIFSPAFLIAFISRVMTLEPGDLILTGTPEGVGPLTPGDTIEIEIGGVGVLSNPVEAA
ncbi:MAG: fumarylacetoacetate hydrolase family protein [Thermomicrobiales bacterium]|nr:fumarylacetoacetate hydrolase family protein [Thermomicrobiales bacterium]